MSTNSIASTTGLQELAHTITTRFDKNNDGALSADEFAGFLSQFSTLLTANASAASAGPAATVDRPVVGTMAGFDAAKLADLSHTTTKYQIGRVLQHYPNTPAGLQAALPEIQQLVPSAKIAGSKGDLLDFGDYLDPGGKRIGVVDVIQSAGLGGMAWQWAPLDA
jgi:hypothetical protein